MTLRDFVNKLLGRQPASATTATSRSGINRSATASRRSGITISAATGSAESRVFTGCVYANACCSIRFSDGRSNSGRNRPTASTTRGAASDNVVAASTTVCSTP